MLTIEPGDAAKLDIFIEFMRVKFPGIESETLRTTILTKLKMCHQEEDYFSTTSGMFYNKQGRDDVQEVQITNFIAKITCEITRDDGLERSKVFEIQAVLQGQTKVLQVRACDFSSMNWVITQLGAGAIIYPGSSIREHARVAIQKSSGDRVEREEYTHLGWRERHGEQIFLHAGGAITKDGIDQSVCVVPPDALAAYSLPGPPAPEELRNGPKITSGLLAIQN